MEKMNIEDNHLKNCLSAVVSERDYNLDLPSPSTKSGKKVNNVFATENNSIEENYQENYQDNYQDNYHTFRNNDEIQDQGPDHHVAQFNPMKDTSINN